MQVISKRSIEESIGVPESTSGKRIKVGIVPILLGRHKLDLTPEMEEQVVN